MNFRARFVFSIGLLGLLCLTTPGALRADDFTFSFTGSLGTVMGEIYGLTNNTSCTACDVTITSVPAAFASDPNLFPPADISAPPWQIVTELFTESAGVLTLAQYEAGAPGPEGFLTTFSLGNDPGIGILDDFYGTDETTVVSFAPVTASEPSSLSLMLTGIGLLGLIAVMRKRISLGHQQVTVTVESFQ
jgi:hypothetical protein